jgi:hypothetical protein
MTMSIIERIQAEIDTIPEESHDELYKVVREFAAAHSGKKKMGLMEKLRAGKKFDGPPDFAENLDQYLNGEKNIEDIEDNIH